MHELSITHNIVSIVAERAGERLVKRVRLQIGKLSGVDVQAVRFCFDVCTRGTVLQDAALEIDEIAGRGVCRGCEREIEVERLVAICHCERRAPLQLVAGQELLVKEMEL